MLHHIIWHHIVSVREWFVLHFLIAWVFIASGLIINTLQLSTLFLVRPFSVALFRRVNVFLAWLHWSQMTTLVEWWSGSDVRLVMEEGEDETKVGKESALVIMNHKYDLDFLFGGVMAERHGLLGSAKGYAKDSLKFVPLIGLTGLMTESIFLKRNMDKDKQTMEQSHDALQTYPLPFWMLLFCEGTRFTKTKHKFSMEVARSKGLLELKHHLLPRTRGFNMALHGFKNKISAIYDITFCVPNGGTEPTIRNILYGKRCYGEMLIRRIPASEVPLESEEATGQWLQMLYQEKDKNFEDFLCHGTFVKTPEEASLGETLRRHIPKNRRLQPLINYVFWCGVTIPPLLRFLVSVVMEGSPWLICATLLVFVLLYTGSRMMFNIHEKGSSFGLKENEERTS